MIDAITLSNWKSHEQAEFKFKPGTNVIVGKMGSGKSSIFQAISFALFGTFSELKKKDVKISELITRGSRRRIAEVQLILRILGKSYKIKRKIDESRGSEATVRDGEEALVAGPNPTAANDYIKSLLKVDDEIFLRTVYAIQNDIDMILKYAPKERKSKIDELMGLDKFEMARDNAQTLRNRISRSKEEIEKLLAGFNVESLKSSLSDLEAQSQVLEKSIYSLKGELDEKRKLQEKARVELSQLREKFREVSKLEERKSSLEKQVAELQGKIKGETLDASKEAVESELRETRQKISSRTEEKKRLASELERIRAELIGIEGKYSVLQDKDSELNGKIAGIEAFKEKFPDIDFQEIASEISELKKLIDEKREQNKMVEVELKNIRKHLEELQLSDAFCPLCKQELLGNKKDELISKKKKEIAEFQYKNSGLKDELYKLEQRKAEIDEIVEGNEKIIESILEEEDINLKKSELSGKIAGLAEARTKAKATYEKLSKRSSSLEQEISELQDRNSSLIEVKFLYDSKARQAELSEELSLVESELLEKGKDASLLESTEKTFETLLKDIQQIETRLESFSELIKEKANRKSDLTQKLDEIKKMEDTAKLMELRVGFLDRLKTAIEATQLTLRDDLVLAVNEVMNSIWLDIYPYDKWQGIRLSASESDYALQLRTLDDAWVNVAGFASGGERMLAALAVRIAFARILAPGLSLLILDEPTHNLDDKAVQTLVEILQEKIANMLDQIFIITHDERLAEAAENVIRI